MADFLAGGLEISERRGVYDFERFRSEIKRTLRSSMATFRRQHATEVSQASDPGSEAPGRQILPGGIQEVAGHELLAQMRSFVTHCEFEPPRQMFRERPEIAERVNAIDGECQSPVSEPCCCRRAAIEPDISRLQLETG